MGVTVKSPVERWAGEVVLCDPLTLEQVMAIEDALDAGIEIGDSKFLSALEKSGDGKVSLQWSSRLDKIYIPVISQCVESHTLPIDFARLPASPRKDSHLLIATLWSELLKIYRGEIEIPNA